MPTIRPHNGLGFIRQAGGALLWRMPGRSTGVPVFPRFAENFESGNLARWTVTTGSPTVVAYGFTTYPGVDISTAIGGGAYQCYGGSVALSEMYVDLSLASVRSAVAGGGVDLHLSGHLGGFATQGDNVRLAATFFNAAGGEVGGLNLGPVTPADRGGITNLIYRAASTRLPASTVRIRLRVIFTRTDGVSNDGYVDNILATLAEA